MLDMRPDFAVTLGQDNLRVLKDFSENLTEGKPWLLIILSFTS